MISVTGVLWALTILLGLAFLLACAKIERLQKDLRDEEARHERCHEATEAALLKQAAKRRLGT